MQKVGFRKGAKEYSPNSRPQTAQAFRQTLEHSMRKENHDPLRGSNSGANARPSTAGSSRREGTVNWMMDETAPASDNKNNSRREFSSSSNLQNQSRPLSASVSQPNFLASGLSKRPSSAGAIRGTSRAAMPINPFDNSIKAPAYVPKFVETDKQVCRFHGHLVQSRNWDEECPIGGPTIEIELTRRMTILFYVSDYTVEIIEEKTANTGKEIIQLRSLGIN